MTISANKVVPAEFKRTIHCMTPESGTELDDVLKPEYYRHVARNFKAMDRIEVMPEDGTWYAELMVMFVGKNELKVSRLSFIKLDNVSPEEAENDEYKVEWGSPSVKYRVIKKSTGDVVKDGFETKESAAAYLAEHTKALAA